MQRIDVSNPGMPDLQFVLMVAALCTSNLPTLNIPEPLRATIFNRCWALVHDTPAPDRMEDRVLDLRDGTELTLEAMILTIRELLTEVGLREITWDHAPSEPTMESTPAAKPLIERLHKLYPGPPDLVDPSTASGQ